MFLGIDFTGAKENRQETVLGGFFSPFPSTPPLSLLGQQDKSQFLAAGANAGPLAWEMVLFTDKAVVPGCLEHCDLHGTCYPPWKNTYFLIAEVFPLSCS